LRAAANHLTAIRDAQVQLDAFEALARHFKRKLPARPFPKIRESLEKNCRSEERKFLEGDAVAKVKRILRKLEQRVGGLKIVADGWPAIAPGLQKSFSGGRETCKRVRTESSPEHFHEWRKRAKDLRCQIRMLCPVWPKELREAAVELETLGECLGGDHDLFMLKEFVTGKFKGARDAGALNELIFSRQNELRSAACKLAARFFAEKPLALCRRLRRHWKIWRSESKK
jgi:CHAD domain-containing protein